MSLLIFVLSVRFLFLQLTYHPTYTLRDSPLMRYINCCVFWHLDDVKRESLWQGDQFYWHFGLKSFMPQHVPVDMCHIWCVAVYIGWRLLFISYIFKFLWSVSLNYTSYFDSLVIDIYRKEIAPTTWLNCSISLCDRFKREICVHNEKVWWDV